MSNDRYIAHNEIDPISILSGLVQTGLYLDFFYGTHPSHSKTSLTLTSQLHCCTLGRSAEPHLAHTDN